MPQTPTIDAITAELELLRTSSAPADNKPLQEEIARLKAEMASMRNDAGFAYMTLIAIGRITGLPANQTLSTLEAWVREHWKPG